jgi:hypothetical protein
VVSIICWQPLNQGCTHCGHICTLYVYYKSQKQYKQLDIPLVVIFKPVACDNGCGLLSPTHPLQKKVWHPSFKITYSYYRVILKSLCTCRLQYKNHIWSWPSENMFRMQTMLYWTRSMRTQFGVSINVWRLVGDTLNITCNFLYCNNQVHRDLFITLYLFHNWSGGEWL